MGTGNDLHGGNYTKAAIRAVQDAIHHSSPGHDPLAWDRFQNDAGRCDDWRAAAGQDRHRGGCRDPAAPAAGGEGGCWRSWMFRSAGGDVAIIASAASRCVWNSESRTGRYDRGRRDRGSTAEQLDPKLTRRVPRQPRPRVLRWRHWDGNHTAAGDPRDSRCHCNVAMESSSPLAMYSATPDSV